VREFLKLLEVLMSGQAGGRGYLIQALVSVLDALAALQHVARYRNMQNWCDLFQK
jgi:hypothetical protein